MFFIVTSNNKMITVLKVLDKRFFWFGLDHAWKAGKKMGKWVEEHESDGLILFFEDCNKIIDCLKSSILEKEINHLDLIISFEILASKAEELPQNLIIIFEEAVLPGIWSSDGEDCIEDFIEREWFSDWDVF